MYTIEVTHTIGDSLNGSSETQSIIGFCTEDFKEIQTVLSYINFHYEFIQKYDHLTNAYFKKQRKTEEEVYNMYRNKPWFCKNSPLTCIQYKDKEIDLSFCYGYFERILSAKIIYTSGESLPPTEIEFY